MNEQILKNRQMNILSNLMRVGIVDGIDEQKGTVRVTFPDRDDLVVEDLAMLGFEQNYPDIQDMVLCLFLPNGIQEGFCLGRYYNEQNPPPIRDKNYFVKKIADDVTIKYHKPTKTLSIIAPGGVKISGDLVVDGSVRQSVVT